MADSPEAGNALGRQWQSTCRKTSGVSSQPSTGWSGINLSRLMLGGSESWLMALGAEEYSSQDARVARLGQSPPA